MIVFDLLLNDGLEGIKDVDKGGVVVIMNFNFYEEYIFKMLLNIDDDKEILNNEIGIFLLLLVFDNILKICFL